MNNLSHARKPEIICQSFSHLFALLIRDSKIVTDCNLTAADLQGSYFCSALFFMFPGFSCTFYENNDQIYQNYASRTISMHSSDIFYYFNTFLYKNKNKSLEGF